MMSFGKFIAVKNLKSIEMFWVFVIFLNLTNASGLQVCNESLVSKHAMLIKPIEWQGFLAAFSILKPSEEIGKIMQDFKQVLRCPAVKIKHIEVDNKIVINAHCNKFCENSSCPVYCIKLNEDENEKNDGGVEWKVALYVHLRYLAIKYSFKDKSMDGIMIFVDTFITWLNNRSRFEKVLLWINIVIIN